MILMQNSIGAGTVMKTVPHALVKLTTNAQHVVVLDFKCHTLILPTAKTLAQTVTMGTLLL